MVSNPMSDEPHREVGVSHVFSVNLPFTPLQSLATHARIRGLWCCPTRSPESLLISLTRHKAIYFSAYTEDYWISWDQSLRNVNKC